MSFPSNLGLADLYRTLGARSGNVPQFSSGAILPVAVVADFARTQTGEPFEPRALAGATLVATAGNYPVWQLTASGGAACVVESIRLKQTSNTASFLVQRADGSLPFPLTPGTIGKADLGGVASKGGFSAAVSPNFPGYHAILPIEPGIQDVGSGQSLRWYLPPGNALIMTLSQVNIAAELTILWREIVSPF